MSCNAIGGIPSDSCDSCNPCITNCPSLSIDKWYQLMRFPRWYGWQWAQDRNFHKSTPIPMDASMPCATLVYESYVLGEFSPEADGSRLGAGREDIWESIRQADISFREFMGFWPRPVQVTEEIQIGHLRDSVFQLSTKKIQALGQIRLTRKAVIVINKSIDYIDLNNDGIYDQLKLEIDLPTGVDLKGLTLVFPEDQWLSEEFCRHEICPTIFKVVGTDRLSITVPARLLHPPTEYLVDPQSPIDPSNLDNFTDTVELWYRDIDPTKQITISRLPNNCGYCQSTDVCYTCENIEGCIVSSNLSQIRLKPSGGDDCFCPSCTDKICVHYIAGDCGWDQLIARLAAARLGKNLCCSPSPEISYYQEEYVSVNSVTGRILSPLSEIERANFFGTRRGEIEAYRALRRNRMYSAAIL